MKRWFEVAGAFVVFSLLTFWATAPMLHSAPVETRDDSVQGLAEEVHGKGWIVYGVRPDQGDWDLAACRPDGSQQRRLTRTPDFNEFSPQFSRDGSQLLYRRLPRGETIDNNRHGEQGELVLANRDGSEPRVLGKAGEFPWASWSSDGRQIASLSIKGISFIDLASRRVVRTLPRRGFFQQLVWSPDGQWLCGVANSFDEIFGDGDPSSNEAVQLAAEIHAKGWLVFSARTEHGDWDLFLMRPEGSDRRPLTDTREFNEAGARFSPDGRRLLFYRMPKAEPVDNNSYGAFSLVLAEADGRDPVELGRQYPWASWSPDGGQIACLQPKGVEIVDLRARTVVKRFPRKGIVSQLVWAPDGRSLAGTANGLGPFWNIGRLNPATGEINPVSETERYNCTPDWLPDSKHILYARGIIPQKGGRAELWAASADGAKRWTLYAEEGRHIYGACSSPDGKYLLFTRSVEDLGRVDNSRTTMAIIRWADTPMLGDESAALRQRLPGGSRGPRLDLGPGWEPHWTYADVAKSSQESAP
jgi:Tol biopolymer transport system component